MREKNEPGEIKYFASVKKPNPRMWWMALFVVAAMALFSACAPTGGDTDPTTPPTDPPPTQPDPDPDPEPVAGLSGVQKAASDAAKAAMTASEMAETAANAAKTARMNLATIQTGGMSMMHAMDAEKYAKMAMDEYMNAKTASEAAAAAEDLVTALRAQVDAENAKTKAEEAQMKAEEAKGKAEMATTMEVMVDGATFTVGDVPVATDAGNRDITFGGKQTITGKIKDLEVSRMVAAVPDDTDTTDKDEGAPAVDERMIMIGATYDGVDDTARVALINTYVGTRNVGAYFDTSGTTHPGSASMIDHDDDDADADASPRVRLRSVSGTYFEAATAADESGNIEVGTKKGVTLKYYEDPDANNAKVYVRELRKTIEGGKTTYTWQVVTATEGLTVKLPVASGFAHLKYGVWSMLKDPDDAGEHDPSELGIAFADGDMTMDMPNFGKAVYKGNWVANVQAADADGDGEITVQVGDMDLSADFRKDTVTVDLKGLADLSEGTITGNTFSGTKMTLEDTDTTTADDIDAAFNLDGSGKFTGTFSGGFFGPRAAEAGGVFSYASEDNHEGAFRGSFGGGLTD